METIEAKTLSDFIKILETNNYVDDNTLFRGHNSAAWKLEPKIARNFKQRRKIDTEEKMVETFKRLSKQFLHSELNNDWDYLALAQHHGMATRLLDWSKNPLAALWFCVNKPCIDESGCVWIMKVEEDDYLKASQLDDKQNPIPRPLKTNDSFEEYFQKSFLHQAYSNPFKIDRIIIYQPHLLDNRIIVQNGWFTAHGRNGDGKYIELSGNENWQNRLVKITIPKLSFSEFRANLDTLGVNQMTLFPDLDGTAYYTEWLHSILEDEPGDQE